MCEVGGVGFVYDICLGDVFVVDGVWLGVVGIGE